MTEAPKNVLVLGASGGVGREILRQGLERGLRITAQTRNADNLANFANRVRVVEGEPHDPAVIARAVTGQDAVIFVLGIDRIGATTLFSDATRVLIEAMAMAGVRRLIAVTGIGAGETRGHGGIFYDRFIFPLFTRNRYVDKDAQEHLIEQSDLDWTIVRPAPFAGSAPSGRPRVVTEIGPDTVLSRITRAQTATFILETLAKGGYIHQKPFIGHP